MKKYLFKNILKEIFKIIFKKLFSLLCHVMKTNTKILGNYLNKPVYSINSKFNFKLIYYGGRGGTL